MIRRPPRSTLFPYTTLFRSLVAAPLVRTDRSALVASGDLALALSGDLVEGRVGNLVGPNLRRSLNHGREVLQHFGIGVAAIGVRVLFPIPQTDGDGVLAVWIEERELVCEAGLFPKSRQDVLLDRPGKLSAGIALEMHRHLSCVHVPSLGCDVA